MAPAAQPADPTGATTAFNITYAVINTYSGVAAPPAVNVTNPPSAGTLTQPDANQWKFKLNTTTTSTGREEINWTIQVPGLSRVCTQCTKVILRFVFFTPTGDKIDPGGNASYAIYRRTSASALARVFDAGSSENNTGATPTIPARTPSVASFCPDANEVCYDATSSVGYNVTLAFKFGWNFQAGTPKVLSVQVGNVALLAPSLANSSAHQMVLNPITNKVLHTANFTSFNFNRTVTTPLPPPVGGNKDFTWSSFNVTLYYPSPYVTLHPITVANATGPAPPLGTTGSCIASDCKSLFSANSTTIAFSQLKSNLQLTITAETRNTMRSISTVIGSLSQTHWQPSESIGLKLNDTLSIHQPGTVAITQIHPSGKTVGPGQTQNSLGSGVFPTTAASSPLGTWKLNATFTSLYDYGANTTSIFVEHLKLAQPLAYSGDNTRVTITGTINSESTTVKPSSGANVAVFGVSTSTSGNYSKNYAPATSGLYITSVIFVNGAFTISRPLIMYLTVVNPSNEATVGNVTISHEFYPGQTHGVNATFSLDKPIDTPLQSGTRFYEVDVTFNNGLMNLKVTSLRSGAQTTATSSLGSPPVFDTRQQFGLFSILIKSAPQAGGQSASNSIETQPFAYVFTNSLVSQGGRVLVSGIAQTDGSGGFLITTGGTAIPQARRLVFIVLARDVNGTTLGNQDPTGATDSLVLCGPANSSGCQPSLDGPNEATPGQTVTMTLRVRNNSTTLGMTLNVTLQVFSGTNIVIQQSKPTGLISPGQSKDISYTFNAPTGLGAYTVSFFSPEYGAPVLITTLNVLLIPTWAQIAIPAIVGVAVAAGLAFFYRRRKPAVAETKTPEKTRPTGSKTPSGTRNP